MDRTLRNAAELHDYNVNVRISRIYVGHGVTDKKPVVEPLGTQMIYNLLELHTTDNHQKRLRKHLPKGTAVS